MSDVGLILSPAEVLEKIPQQEPFRFVDEIYSIDDDGVEAGYCWRADAGFYRGHFPGNPVLPGIVQVHWVVTASRFLFGMSNGPGEIKRLKFKSVVTPPNVIELALCRPSECEVQFDYSSLGRQHSQGRLIFDEHVSC